MSFPQRLLLAIKITLMCWVTFSLLFLVCVVIEPGNMEEVPSLLSAPSLLTAFLMIVWAWIWHYMIPNLKRIHAG